MIYHPANKTTRIHNGDTFWRIVYIAILTNYQMCLWSVAQHLKTYFQCSWSPPKSQKTALCCLLFHKFFPYSLPFCGLDWLCYTQCANIQPKPNGNPAQKHYPALWWAPGPAHPVHISHRRATISPASLGSVCAVTLDESRGRPAG